MPALIPLVVAVAAGSAIGGITESIIAASNKPKAPGAAAAPDPNAAAAAAQAAQTDARKTFLASGGQTDFTGGLGILTGSDVSKSTLVGS
jgi:hypothetical protein